MVRVVDPGPVAPVPMAPLGSEPADAFRELSVRHLDGAYRLAWAILGDDRGAEAATEDAFAAAWRQRRTVREPDRFEAWLWRVVVDNCRDALRRRARARSDTLDPAWLSVVAGAEPATSNRDALDRALASLDPDHRIVVILRFWADLGVAEIAQRTGVPSGTVNARLLHAMRALGAAFEDRTADDDVERRLHVQIHRRIVPPVVAPEVLRARIAGWSAGVEPVRSPRARPARRTLGLVGGLAAATAVAAIVAGALLGYRGSVAIPGDAQLPATIEMFTRIDARTAVAWHGHEVFTTRDAGSTWRRGTLPGQGLSTDDGSAVGASFPERLFPAFIDADHGWVLTWKMSNSANPSESDFTFVVHRTADGGRTWTESAVPGTYRGYGELQFVDARHGFIVVPRMDLSTRFGANGQSTPSLPPDATIALATSDGGATWTRVHEFASTPALQFVTAQEGWAVTTDYGIPVDSTAVSAPAVVSVSHTDDGGRTWTDATLPTTEPCHPQSVEWQPTRTNGALRLAVACINSPAGSVPAPEPTTYPTPAESSTPWVSGPEATGISPSIDTFVSRDDGRTWQLEASRTSELPSSLAGGWGPRDRVPQPFVMQPGAYQVGGSGAGLFRASFDRGATWREYALQGLPSFVPVAEFASPDDVWVLANGDASVNGGGLYATRDGGKTWRALLGAAEWPVAATPTPSGMPTDALPSFAPETPQPATIVGRIHWLDARTGWVESFDGSPGDITINPMLRVTIDGGTTWSEPRMLPVAYSAFGESIEFADADHGWVAVPDAALGRAADVYRTNDGGRSWHLTTVSLDRGERGAGVAVHFRDATHGELFLIAGSDTPAEAPSEAPAEAPSAAPSDAAPICRRFSSNDGGATWPVSAKTPCITMATFADATLGYAFLLPSAPTAAGLTTVVTLDGGRSWLTPAYPKDVTAVPLPLLVERRADKSLHMVANVGGSVTVFSSRDGKTWAAERPGPRIPYGAIIHAAAFGEGSWIVTTYGAPGTGAGVQRTVDGGASWQVLPASGLPGNIAGLEFPTEADGWAIAAEETCDAQTSGSSCQSGDWALYRTTDGGLTWAPVLLP